MAVYKVEEMHCEKCVERITSLLTEEGMEFEVRLEDKTVSVVGDEEVQKKAVEALDDLGFTAVLA